MSNRLLKSFTALTVCCLMLFLALPASGQFRIEIGRAHDTYGADRVARQAEVHTGQFAAALDRESERARFDERTEDTRLNERARDVESQMTVVSQDLDRDSRNSDIRSDVASAF